MSEQLAIKTRQCMGYRLVGQSETWTMVVVFFGFFLSSFGGPFFFGLLFVALENWGYTLGFSGHVKGRGSTSGELGACRVGNWCEPSSEGLRSPPRNLYNFFFVFFVQVSDCSGFRLALALLDDKQLMHLSDWEIAG